jgi:hypothetical protein
MSPRQGICSVCDQVARPGSAIVRSFGAGGRVHEVCPPPPSEKQLAARADLNRSTNAPGSDSVPSPIDDLPPGDPRA